MKFDEWLSDLSDYEKVALCNLDVWNGAIDSAIKSLRREKEVLIRHNLKQNANGVQGAINILEEMKDSS